MGTDRHSLVHVPLFVLSAASLLYLSGSAEEAGLLAVTVILAMTAGKAVVERLRSARNGPECMVVDLRG